MGSVVNTKGHFQIDTAVARIQGIGLIQFCCPPPMFPPLFSSSFILRTRTFVCIMLARVALMFSSIPDGLQIVIPVERIGSTYPGAKHVRVVLNNFLEEIACIACDQPITHLIYKVWNRVNKQSALFRLFNDPMLFLDHLNIFHCTDRREPPHLILVLEN